MHSTLLVPVTQSRKMQLALQFEAKVTQVLERCKIHNCATTRKTFKRMLVEAYQRRMGKSNITLYRVAQLPVNDMIRLTLIN